MSKKLPTDLKVYLAERSVQKENGCIEWTKSKDKQGYGSAQVNKINWRAHRLAYSVYNNISREDMEGLLVCHRCDNPSCINPEHLFLGTHTDNNRDTVSKGRHVNHKQKLSPEQISEIKEKYGPQLLTSTRGRRKQGQLTYKEVGRLYGVYDTTIRQIIHGKEEK